MSQSFGFSWHIFFNILLRTPFILSQSPLHFGLYGVVNNCLSGISLQTSFIRSEVNWLPFSLKISVGKPTLESVALWQDQNSTQSMKV